MGTHLSGCKCAELRGSPLTPTALTRSVSEEDFWRNYFSHIFAIKRQFALQAAGDAMPGGRAAPEEAGSSCAAAPSQLLPRQLSAAQLAAVSYPEKFHLAVQYGVHGPPLPNLSDADRILLEVSPRDRPPCCGHESALHGQLTPPASHTRPAGSADTGDRGAV
eukprot:scaffold5390_cov116-Isochrysis_galbana.AAC.6